MLLAVIMYAINRIENNTPNAMIIMYVRLRTSRVHSPVCT